MDDKYDLDDNVDDLPLALKKHPDTFLWRIHKSLASAKLAMALLVVILGCCLVGVTIIRDERATKLIFSSLWFNALLVMLIVNVAFCFFSRIWGRKVTLISLGMILFHLSFVSLFAGVVYNSLFYFRGVIRLTEGETLPNDQIQSYDVADRGRFFKFSRLRGETTLVKMITGYKVDGSDMRAAYDVAISDGPRKKQETIFVTKNLEYRGFKYYNDKEGYVLLVVLHDKHGNELYGGYMPLQSVKQDNEVYQYVTGTKEGLGVLALPQGQEKPLIGFRAVYHPDSANRRTGQVAFDVWRLKPDGKPEDKASMSGKVPVGSMFDAGEYQLSVKEVRYWAAMMVRYEPGRDIVLSSMWVGLFGATLTTLARIYRKRNK